MKNVYDGKDYRVFQDKLLRIWPYYILEDSSEAQQKGGTWIGVKLKYFYFKTLKQVLTFVKE